MKRLCLLALACALAAPAAANATFPGGTGKLAVDVRGSYSDETGRASYRNITTVGADSRGDKFLRECQITGTGVRMGDCTIDYRTPAWSPNGRRLVFDAGRGLAVMNADGSGFSTLAPFTSGDGQPAWSRSGRELVFAGEGKLWVANPVTRRLRRLARRGADPDWSSRNLIAFERGGSIWSMKPNGRSLRRIARGKDPSWAANGRSLVFARRGGIYTVRADGKRLRRIVRCSGCRTPVLSPSGRQVAYEDGEVVVAGTRDGRRESSLIAESEAADAANPSWQAR